MLSFSWSKVRNAKIGSPAVCESLLARVIFDDARKQRIVVAILQRMGEKPDRCLNSEELGQVQRQLGVSRTTMWRVMKHLKRIGLVDITPLGERDQHYFLSHKFPRVVGKVRRAAMRLLPPTWASKG